ncbi:MAG: hypothetical protein NT045_09655 [Candidatus Aureabacteria bacterium]|nr:hypothetical protein [Candidatus Auribacterota bacterium]
MRVVKGVLFCVFFTALCAGCVLGVMRGLAARAHSPGLFQTWVGEIRDAVGEAGDCIADSRRGFGRLCGRFHGKTIRSGGA